jgi:hypothetical protein
LEKKNFLPQVTKTKNKDLTEDEKDYHSAHGAFRSKQETERNANIVHTWAAFSSKSEKKNTSFENLQLQLKFILVLDGLSKMAFEYPQFFNCLQGINDWLDEDFDFLNFQINVESEKIQELQERSLELQKDQLDFIHSLLESPLRDIPKLQLENIISSNSTNEITSPIVSEKMNKKKKKKKELQSNNQLNEKAKRKKLYKFSSNSNYSTSKQNELIELFNV